jgi:hypothetical protein
VVGPAAGLALALEDLAALPAPEREAAARARAAAEAERPFDLSAGPLLRAALLRLGPEEHVLLLTLHHIAADGWSLGVLVRELAGLYPAALAGDVGGAGLAPLAVQYPDYAVWQRGWLSGEALERQLGYWRERLAGAPAALELPADRARPPAQTFRGATASAPLPAGLAAELRALAEREGATPFMALLAGFAALLGRYSGQADLVRGTPVANRGRRELEGLFGCGRAASGPTPTRTCRSSGWSRSCGPSATPAATPSSRSSSPTRTIAA